MNSSKEKYIKKIIHLFGSPTAINEINLEKKRNIKNASATSLCFENSPQEGCMTSISYGFSEEDRSEWYSNKRPELYLSVNSKNPQWTLVGGRLAAFLKYTDCMAEWGTTACLSRPICDDTTMNSLFFYMPYFEDKSFSERASFIDIGLHYTINLVQAYPIHEAEIPLIEKIGPEKFFTHEGWDMYDINRKPLI